MTDLVIKGVKIPDRRTIELMRTELACVSCDECDRLCQDCDLVQDTDDLIMALSESIRVLEAVANAVLLPGVYGRLIDADALIRDKSGEVTLWCGYEYQDHFVVFERDIKNAPTIVPAKENGEADKKTNCSDCDNQNTPVCKYCEHDAKGENADDNP